MVTEISASTSYQRQIMFEPCRICGLRLPRYGYSPRTSLRLDSPYIAPDVRQCFRYLFIGANPNLGPNCAIWKHRTAITSIELGFLSNHSISSMDVRERYVKTWGCGFLLIMVSSLRLSINQSKVPTEFAFPPF